MELSRKVATIKKVKQDEDKKLRFAKQISKRMKESRMDVDGRSFLSGRLKLFQLTFDLIF